jgi:hypothetical protein
LFDLDKSVHVHAVRYHKEKIPKIKSLQQYKQANLNAESFRRFLKSKKNLKLKKNFKNFNYFSNFQNLVSQLDLLSFFKKEIFQIFLMLSGKYSKVMLRWVFS